MNYFIVFIILSAFIKNATPKVYILNLTNRGTEDDRHIKLVDVLKLIKGETQERQLVERSNDVDDCLMQLVTKAEKLKCLEKLHKPDKRMLSYIYPNYLQFVGNRPKRTVYSLYNYYGDVVKSIPITDVSRQQFSQDYLDISDLSRFEPECESLQCIEADSHKNDKPSIQVTLNYPKRNNHRRIFENLVQKSRSSSESSDSDDDSSDSDKRKESNDSDRKKRKDSDKKKVVRNSHKRKEGKRQKPSRFQVVFNDDSAESESEERKVKSEEEQETESEDDVKSKPKKKPVYSDDSTEEVTEKSKTEKYAYLQGNKVYNNFRKRMQHFLPKRFHWDEDDMRHLGYYWFDGPRGKFDTS